MPDIAPISVDQPGAAGDVIATVKQQFGSVPNIFATMAQSPATLQAFLAFSGAFGKATLSGKIREQIALTVAGQNECDYCASAHTAIAASLGIDKHEAADNLTGRSADPKTNAILRFVAEVVRDRAKLADNGSSLNRLRSAGVTDAEIVEVIATVAINIFTNYFNHVAGTDIDFPYVNAAITQTAA
jgi:uncharacterized peroxidase-related enzyme